MMERDEELAGLIGTFNGNSPKLFHRARAAGNFDRRDSVCRRVPLISLFIS
jgi:hypothetical protein